MLQYYIRHAPHEEFSKVERPLDGDIWVHGSQVVKTDLHQLAERYNLNFNVLHDVLDQNELPRVEAVDGALYVFFRMPTRTDDDLVGSAPLLTVIKERGIITLLAHNSKSTTALTPAVLSRADGPHQAMLAIFAAIVSEYETFIKRTAHRIEDTGKRLRTHEVTNDDFIHFVTVEEDLAHYQMSLTGMQVAAERLRDMLEVLHDKESVDDIVLHIKQLLVAIESHNHSIASIRNAYSTIANNTLNQRMKTLTVLTLLVALPNVFYGMYGMNIGLPFQESPFAYAGIVLFTFLLILTVYWVAKTRQLL